MTGDELVIADRSFGSRLIVGTGKYASFEQMAEAIEAAGSKTVTVAIRRVDFDERVGDITSFLPDDVLLSVRLSLEAKTGPFDSSWVARVRVARRFPTRGQTGR